MDIKIRSEETQSFNKSLFNPGVTKIEKKFRWVAPNWSWFKLNTDGTHKTSGLSSAGDLIRNHCGEWITSFGMNIGLR